MAYKKHVFSKNTVLQNFSRFTPNTTKLEISNANGVKFTYKATIMGLRLAENVFLHFRNSALTIRLPFCSTLVTVTAGF